MLGIMDQGIMTSSPRHRQRSLLPTAGFSLFNGEQFVLSKTASQYATMLPNGGCVENGAGCSPILKLKGCAHQKIKGVRIKKLKCAHQKIKGMRAPKNQKGVRTKKLKEYAHQKIKRVHPSKNIKWCAPI